MAEHIGSKVTIPGSQGYGILRYYGPIRGKSGKFGGIELQGPIAAIRGKNSGDVEGVSYFEVETPMTGLFLPWDRLVNENPHLDSKLFKGSLLKPPERVKKPVDLVRGSIANSSTSLVSGKRSINASPVTSRPSTASPNQFQQIQVTKRNGLFDGVQRSASTNYVSRNLDQELEDLKAKYASAQAEIIQKNFILNELQSTVDEIQPLLEEYENNLAEKDNKLLKLKQDFENAREEWRESIDLMTANQQENEDYYMSQIEIMKESIDQMDQKGGQDETVKALESEIADLKAKLDTEVNHLLQEKDSQIKMLNDKLIEIELSASLEKDLRIQKPGELLTDSDVSKQITKLTEELSDKQNKIDHLETELKDLVDKTNQQRECIVELEQEVKKRSMSNSQANDEELFITILQREMEITKLKEQLEFLNKTISDNSDSSLKVAKLEQEISELKQQLEKPKTNEAVDDLISVKEELEKAQKTVKDQQEVIAELEIKNKSILEEKAKEIKDKSEQESSKNSGSTDMSYSAECINDLKVKIESLMKENEQLKSKNEDFEKEKETIESEYLRQQQLLKQEHMSVLEELGKRESSIESKEEESLKAEKLQQEIELWKTKTISIEEYNELKERHEDLKQKYQETENNANPKILSQLEVELNSIKQENERLNSQIAKDRELEQKVKLLTEQNNIMKQSLDQDNTQLSRATDDNGAGAIKLEEYKNAIEELKHELQMRPTFEELVELQNSLDELDSLHKAEFNSKDQEISKLNKEIDKLHTQLINMTPIPENKENLSPLLLDNINSPPKSDTLPIYNPPVKIDPSTGKDVWCGLCERDGHNSINCPYENDIF